MKSEPELYKPAEACRIAEVAPYVLRYWETEFPALGEGKEKGPARLYSARDVKIISRIRELLYDEGFTVAGAKKRLEAEISEARFEDGLKMAASPEEQRRAVKAVPAARPAPTVAEPVFLTVPVSASKAAPSPADFPGRRKVIQELKELLRLLDRTRKT
jgi:DNA-binding transcriptional MerR regulator